MKLITGPDVRDSAEIDISVDPETGFVTFDACSDCHGCDFRIDLSNEERELLIEFLTKGKTP